MVVPPIAHPKCWSFLVRKAMGLLGKPTILGTPPFYTNIWTGLIWQNRWGFLPTWTLLVTSQRMVDQNGQRMGPLFDQNTTKATHLGSPRQTLPALYTYYTIYIHIIWVLDLSYVLFSIYMRSLHGFLHVIVTAGRGAKIPMQTRADMGMHVWKPTVVFPANKTVVCGNRWWVDDYQLSSLQLIE